MANPLNSFFWNLALQGDENGRLIVIRHLHRCKDKVELPCYAGTGEGEDRLQTITPVGELIGHAVGVALRGNDLKVVSRISSNQRRGLRTDAIIVQGLLGAIVPSPYVKYVAYTCLPDERLGDISHDPRFSAEIKSAFKVVKGNLKCSSERAVVATPACHALLWDKLQEAFPCLSEMCTQIMGGGDALAMGLHGCVIDGLHNMFDAQLKSETVNGIHHLLPTYYDRFAPERVDGQILKGEGFCVFTKRGVPVRLMPLKLPDELIALAA
ncbi:MAG: hypothetical protein ABIH87_02500 [bacterium]